MSADLAHWTPRERPGTAPIDGRTVRVEPIVDDSRFGELHAAFAADDGGMWRWLAYGPFADEAAFRAFAGGYYFTPDPLFHAIVPLATGKAAGVASLMRIDQPNGVVEVGHIALAPSLQRTPATTEMQYLLMRRAFDELGYRRYEWKCNNRNELSKRAAVRLGFRFEGVFRQHMVVRNENRDTAWFSITDGEWPALKAAFEAWLDPANFDGAGRQKRRLEDLRPPA